jgi:hypothetical protein
MAARAVWRSHLRISALGLPFVVPLHDDGADSTFDGVLIGEDADDVGRRFTSFTLSTLLSRVDELGSFSTPNIAKQRRHPQGPLPYKKRSFCPPPGDRLLPHQLPSCFQLVSAAG